MKMSREDKQKLVEKKTKQNKTKQKKNKKKKNKKKKTNSKNFELFKIRISNKNKKINII